MTRKRNPSLIPRFTGAAGRVNLLTAICTQKVVGGDTALARRLSAAGELHDYAASKPIMHQGDADNDLYLILSGSVSTVINQREIAVRHAGTHVGEMALLDPTARRSATVIAKERTLVLKLSEHDVTQIAETYPELWRRLALELAVRLRERTKFIRQPNTSPLVFIGSSSEAISEAKYLHRALARHDLTCQLWEQGIFQLSQTTIEDLLRVAGEYDFAILFLTPDDTTASRGRRKVSPRDNVVFELGLFMGALGRDRTYIVAPAGVDLKVPTDLLGLTRAPYILGTTRTLGRRLRPVSRVLWQRISALGPR
jgi:CRP/FNR family transcriptional regulator, cyclic AMP receptor protein